MARALKSSIEHPISVRFGKDDSEMLKRLRVRARASKRSISDLIKYYTFIGIIGEENPDLPLSMIEGILEAREELNSDLGQPYQWGVLEHR